MQYDFTKAKVPTDYDPKFLVPQFETVALAKERKTELLRALTESKLDYTPLIMRLERCRKLVRCRSAACPICVRSFRRWWCSGVTQLMDSTDIEVWQSITIVDDDQSFPLGELNRFNPQLMKDRFRKQVDRSELADAIMLGGIDFNLSHFEGRSPKWYPHIYLLTNAGSKEQILSSIKRHYRTTADVRFPVIVRHIESNKKDYAWRATYSFKSLFDEHPKQNACSWSRNYPPLPAEYLPELSDALDKWGFGKRLIRRGYSELLPEIRFR